MNYIITLIVLGLYILLSLAFLPLQYRYIKALKEEKIRNEEKGIGQGEMYEKMSFEMQQLHFNTQGNILLFGANLMAELLYKHKHKVKKRKK